MNEVVGKQDQHKNSGKWTPTAGRVTEEFVKRKLAQRGAPDQTAMEKVVEEAKQILGNCIPPYNEIGHDAGLVVGYVQSGKTLSFTTVAALARDNGYAIVIVLAGIAINLKNQSESRLLGDLGLEDFSRDWKHFENPTKDIDSVDIANKISSWKKNYKSGLDQPKLKPSLLITVLKHHGRINDLTELLKQIHNTVGLDKVPVLIIDDESDQASLNTKAQKNKKFGTSEKSTTYERILDLRATIPHHTYLQYTATPQANLLIGLMDVLSPTFVELLFTGDAYVGGKYFFQQHLTQCIEIPIEQIPADDNSLTIAPHSLQEALRFFLLGAACHYCQGSPGNRSMMIHPSQKTIMHVDYKDWIDGLVTQWTEFLEQPATSPVRINLLKELKQTYDALRLTATNLQPFNVLIESLSDVFEDLKVVKVNSKTDGERDVKWKQNSYWILVGGQKLDRGFTVEGLTVTYMPRPISANADTLQQRARFFGYKKSYAGLCRIFLVQDAIDAFKNYVESEEFVRQELKNLQGKPLKNWKRDFILHRALSPTRKNIIGREIEKIDLNGGWVVPNSLFIDREAVNSNKHLFLTQAEEWQKNHNYIDAGDKPEFKDIRKSSTRNILIEGVPIESILNFLLEIQIKSIDDSNKISATIMSLVQHKEENANALADIFLIGGLSTDGLEGRKLSGSKINNLFVGRSPSKVKKLEDLNYVGDRALKTERVTLHLRMLKFLPSNFIDPSVENAVPWFSVWLPEAVAKDCIIEE